MAAAPSLGSPLTSFCRLVVYGGFTVALIPLQFLAVGLKLSLRKKLPHWYHRKCCRILGFEIETRGTVTERRPRLFVCNHVSYLDITILGACIRGSFIAKSDVAGWPFFGVLAKLQETVFVIRDPRRVADQTEEIRVRIAAGDDLILFPEGTSGDGNYVLPFKSALFSVAEKAAPETGLVVQPVTIAYTRLDGLPMGRYLRPFFAWYGDMELAQHLWRAVGMGRLTVAVQFHAPVDPVDFASRKALSDHCQATISKGLAAALAGGGDIGAVNEGTGS